MKLNIGYFADGLWSHLAFQKLIKDQDIEISFICARFNTKDKILRNYCSDYGIDYLKHENINSKEFIECISKYEKELPNRRFFVFEIHEKRTCHIHLVKKNTYWFKRHIAFRDELRNNKKTMFKYQELKLQLSAKDWESGEDYANAKTHFIRSIEKRILNGY